jgi:hypothetical protein
VETVVALIVGPFVGIGFTAGAVFAGIVASALFLFALSYAASTIIWLAEWLGHHLKRTNSAVEDERPETEEWRTAIERFAREPLIAPEQAAEMTAPLLRLAKAFEDKGRNTDAERLRQFVKGIETGSRPE